LCGSNFNDYYFDNNYFYIFLDYYLHAIIVAFDFYFDYCFAKNFALYLKAPIGIIETFFFLNLYLWWK